MPEIVFEQAVGSIIYDILQSEGLNENPDQLYKKLSSKQLTNGQITRLAVEGIAMGKNRPDELSFLLQKGLNTQQAIAERVAKEITLKVLPFAQKVEAKKESEETLATIKKTDQEDAQGYVKRPQISNVEENAKTMNKSRAPVLPKREPVLPDSEPDETKLPKDKFPTVPEKRGTSVPDKYRESIG